MTPTRWTFIWCLPCNESAERCVRGHLNLPVGAGQDPSWPHGNDMGTGRGCSGGCSTSSLQETHGIPQPLNNPPWDNPQHPCTGRQGLCPSPEGWSSSDHGPLSHWGSPEPTGRAPPGAGHRDPPGKGNLRRPRRTCTSPGGERLSRAVSQGCARWPEPPSGLGQAEPRCLELSWHLAERRGVTASAEKGEG